MSSEFSIKQQDGRYHLLGVLNEYADLSPLLAAQEPLRLHMGGLSKLNSIGILNFLRFLSDWGPRPIHYESATSEFIDQLNMIPSLKGVNNHAVIESFFVPWQCLECDHEDAVLMNADQVVPQVEAGNDPERKCPKCSSDMSLLVDSYFEFLVG
jgi:hypothetical protein